MYVDATPDEAADEAAADAAADAADAAEQEPALHRTQRVLADPGLFGVGWSAQHGGIGSPEQHDAHLYRRRAEVNRLVLAGALS